MTALSTMPFLGNMVTLILRRDIPIVIVYRIQREMGTAMGTAISCIFHQERSKISFGIGAQRYIVLWVYIFGKYTIGSSFIAFWLCCFLSTSASKC